MTLVPAHQDAHPVPLLIILSPLIRPSRFGFQAIGDIPRTVKLVSLLNTRSEFETVGYQSALANLEKFYLEDFRMSSVVSFIKISQSWPTMITPVRAIVT